MKYMAILAFATFITISMLVSTRKDWFGFVYDVPGGDKSFHFVGMGLLSFFMVLGFSSLTTHSHRRGPVAMVTAIALLVTLDELIQLAIPSRTFSIGDLAWSLAGVVVFGVAATAIQWIRQRRHGE